MSHDVYTRYEYVHVCAVHVVKVLPVAVAVALHVHHVHVQIDYRLQITVLQNTDYPGIADDIFAPAHHPQYHRQSTAAIMPKMHP